MTVSIWRAHIVVSVLLDTPFTLMDTTALQLVSIQVLYMVQVIASDFMKEQNHG